MARIRSIKPEFPQSESIGRLTRDARLLFVQLWTFVDDEGRARASSRMLASLLYPYDDDAPALISGWLSELEKEGLARLYDVEGARYIEITNWLKHQKIDHPSKSRLPPFSEGSSAPREASRILAPDLGPRTLDLGPRIKDAADAAPVPSEDADYYRRGKQLFGQKAASLLTQLKTAKGGSVPLARAALEQASTKDNPREYIGGIIRNTHDPGRQTVDPRL